MRESTKQRLLMILRIVVVVTIGSGVYGVATTASGANHLAFLRGAVTGVIIVLPLLIFEIAYVDTAHGEWLRRRPFVQLLAIKTVVYLMVILLGQELGELLISIGAEAFRIDRAFLHATLFGAAFALVINFVVQIDRVLGRGVLMNFVAGRYHRPRQEERVFLFLDLVGSTALAERLGGARFMDLLNQVYRDIAEPIVEHRGEIHKYVGDEVIITWTMAEGLAHANAVRCAFAIEGLLARKAEFYWRVFGTVPRFRAGLHLGEVVSGELGDIKQEIAFLGDAMNTTSRLVDICRDRERQCVVSSALLDRLSLPQEISAEALGPIRLRGKEEALPLFALSQG